MQFDQLTRTFAQNMNRKQAIKATVALVASGFAIGRNRADAVCRPNGSYCQRNNDCCSGTCGGSGFRARICVTPIPQDE